MPAQVGGVHSPIGAGSVKTQSLNRIPPGWGCVGPMVDSCSASVCNLPISLRQSKRDQRPPGGDGDVLPPFELVAHRVRIDGGAHLKIPERLARAGVEREEVAFGT